MTATPETQLDVYNQALMLCEERTLASLSEDRKPRRLLDQVWNNGGVNACLEESDWIFARRTAELVYDPSIQPDFGYMHAFEKPSDWLRTSAIASDPYFVSALTQYQDEAGYLWSDLQTIYFRYISKDNAYGMDMNKWSESFKQFVAVHLASKIVGSLTHDKQIQVRVAQQRATFLKSSRSKDAMNEPPGFFPRGQLSRARQGLYFGRPGRVGSAWY